MFHIMARATIRQLRTEFPKVRAMIEREGEVVVTERGQAAYVIRPYQPPKPISAATERFLDADRDHRCSVLP